LNNPDILKLVGYFGEGSHISSQRALAVKDIFYKRNIPYVYNGSKLNYELDVDWLEEMMEEDIKQGLIPFWCGFSYGTTFSGAIDISERAFKLCKKHKVWINVDAAWLGSTWIS
jgi:glutamate/tyrosine decarboxylase-like PLP-dependent enzyme